LAEANGRKLEAIRNILWLWNGGDWCEKRLLARRGMLLSCTLSIADVPVLWVAVEEYCDLFMCFLRVRRWPKKKLYSGIACIKYQGTHVIWYDSGTNQSSFPKLKGHAARCYQDRKEVHE
jgi:hypothetical protein